MLVVNRDNLLQWITALLLPIEDLKLTKNMLFVNKDNLLQ